MTLITSGSNIAAVTIIISTSISSSSGSKSSSSNSSSRGISGFIIMLVVNTISPPLIF